MKFQITPDIIKKSVRASNCECAVAISIREKLGLKIRDVYVNGKYLFINGRKHWTPAKASRFIKKFDDYEDVEPTEFELLTVR